MENYLKNIYKNNNNNNGLFTVFQQKRGSYNCKCCLHYQKIKLSKILITYKDKISKNNNIKTC